VVSQVVYSVDASASHLRPRGTNSVGLVASTTSTPSKWRNEATGFAPTTSAKPRVACSLSRSSRICNDCFEISNARAIHPSPIGHAPAAKHAPKETSTVPQLPRQDEDSSWQAVQSTALCFRARCKTQAQHRGLNRQGLRHSSTAPAVSRRNDGTRIPTRNTQLPEHSGDRGRTNQRKSTMGPIQLRQTTRTFDETHDCPTPSTTLEDEEGHWEQHSRLPPHSQPQFLQAPRGRYCRSLGGLGC
jgi:hypothetical protein